MIYYLHLKHAGLIIMMLGFSPPLQITPKIRLCWRYISILGVRHPLGVNLRREAVFDQKSGYIHYNSLGENGG
jgi:hypothetical protein